MYKNQKINIVNNFRQIRQEKRLTLVEISNRTGIQIATLSRIQNGLMPGTLETNIAIADALGVPLADLFKKMPPSSKTLIKHHTALKSISVSIQSNGKMLEDFRIDGKKFAISINGETKISIE